MARKTCLLIFTLNLIGLNSPTKRQGKDLRKKTQLYCLQERHFTSKDTYRLKMKQWNKIF